MLPVLGPLHDFQMISIDDNDMKLPLKIESLWSIRSEITQIHLSPVMIYYFWQEEQKKKTTVEKTIKVT